MEEQTKKLGEKIDEQRENQLEPDLIKFDEPPKVPMLLDSLIPEPAAIPKEKVIIYVNVGMDKKCNNNFSQKKMPSELLGESPTKLKR